MDLFWKILSYLAVAVLTIVFLRFRDRQMVDRALAMRQANTDLKDALRQVKDNARYPRYPVILCGDQLEFEQEHANTRPKERPDWPLPSFDAKDWAEHFCKLNPEMKDKEDLMIAWFANALMRGYDEGIARMSKGKT
jgi:hypothetical protein